MKVFVTGHQGFIGAHLVELLKAEGHIVTGCDIGLFDGCEWEPLISPDREIRKDVRALTPADVEGHDCVMHLAAISNDPMGDLDPGLTYGINRDASIKLAETSKAAGVPRYLFSSSCSVYGKGETSRLAETDTLMPLTAYAKSKIETEDAVSRMAGDDFTPAYLRNSTAYGHSRNLRVDLVVNNLLATALSYGEIRIMSDGTPWRPLIHCRDIARAFIAFMNAPKEAIHNKAINIGGNDENYQVRDIGDLIQQVLPEAKIVYTGEVGSDSRDYCVSFDLLNSLLPDFELQYTLASGIDELFERMTHHHFGASEFEGDQFVRLRALKKTMHLIGAAGS